MKKKDWKKKFDGLLLEHDKEFENALNGIVAYGGIQREMMYKFIEELITEAEERGRREGYSDGWNDKGQAFEELRELLRPYHEELEPYTDTLEKLLAKLKEDKL